MNEYRQPRSNPEQYCAVTERYAWARELHSELLSRGSLVATVLHSKRG